MPEPGDYPLARLLDSLERPKILAFLNLFACRLDDLVAYQRGGEDFVRTPKMDKWECEGVPGWEDFYQRELPALGLTTYAEGERSPALGLGPGSTEFQVVITITEKGFQARDEWRARLRDSGGRLMTPEERDDMGRRTDALDDRLAKALGDRAPRNA